MTSREVNPAVVTSPAADLKAGDRAAGRRVWLLGPWIDLLLIANVAWPLLLLAQNREGFDGREGVQFWQLYYVTTPHRWITLVLVFLDRERFRERKRAFLMVAAAITVVCFGVRLTTGTLTCLLTIDYIWNAWHFAAQHHGIYRIYDRFTDPTRTRGVAFEKWSLRIFLLYVILRVAGATWSQPVLEAVLQSGDWLAACVPIYLLGSDLLRTRGRSPGQTIYLFSVCALYLSMLAAAHERLPGFVLILATASALFHAVEYLTLVTWSVQRRKADGPDRTGLLGMLAARWAITLGLFMLVLGAAGWLLDQHLLQMWLLVNVIVAFLHYAYDGMIWRYRPRRDS